MDLNYFNSFMYFFLLLNLINEGVFFNDKLKPSTKY